MNTGRRDFLRGAAVTSGAALLGSALGLSTRDAFAGDEAAVGRIVPPNLLPLAVIRHPHPLTIPNLRRVQVDPERTTERRLAPTRTGPDGIEQGALTRIEAVLGERGEAISGRFRRLLGRHRRLSG